MIRTLFATLVACVVLAAVAAPAAADPVSAFTATETNGSQRLANVALGLDFDVVGAGGTWVFDLGVFDSGLDGLQSDHWVHIYDRNTGISVASVFVDASLGGTLIGGYVYVPLDTPVFLPAGFLGAIAVDYLPGNLDYNGNVHGNLLVDLPPIFDGNGILTNVGIARYGVPAGFYPSIPDTVYAPGPANRYHAGSFRYGDLESSIPTPEPGTLVLLGAAGMAAGCIRRRREKKLTSGS